MKNSLYVEEDTEFSQDPDQRDQALDLLTNYIQH